MTESLLISANSPLSARSPGRGISIAIEILFLLALVSTATIAGWRPGRIFAPFDSPAASASPHDPRFQSAHESVALTRYAAARLSSGDLPLWDPQVQRGIPLIGVGRSAVLFPTTFLHLLFPPTISWLLAALFKLWAAALGTWLLAKHFGLARPARIMAAISFALSGLLLRAPHDAAANVLCLIPWIAFTIERLMQRPTPFRLAAAAIVFAFIFLGGDPAALISAAALGVAVTAATAFSRWRERAKNPAPAILTVLFAALVAVAIGGIQLFPLGEYLNQLPALSMRPILPQTQWPIVHDLLRAPWPTPPIFTGLAAFCALFAILQWRQSRVRYWLVILLLWATATAFFAGLLTRGAPARIPALLTPGLLAGVLLPISMLAGAGLEAFAAAAPRDRSIRLLRDFAILLAVAAVVLLLSSAAIRLARPAALPSALSLLIAAAFVAAAWLAILYPPRGISPAHLILALAACEMLIVAIPFAATSPAAAATSAPLAAALPELPDVPIDPSFPRAHAWMAASARYFPQRADILRQMRRPLDFDPRKTVLIDSEADNYFDEPLGTFALDGDPKWFTQHADASRLPSVQYRAISPEQVEVALTGFGPSAGWLVTSDPLYPGWQATMSDAAIRFRRFGMPATRHTPIIPTFGTMRALYVPQGIARVTFTYDPPAGRWGCFASVGGLLAWMLIVGAGFFSASQSPENSGNATVKHDRMDLD